MAGKERYGIEQIPRMRGFAMDAGYLGRRRHIVHGLIEADVTFARARIRAHKEKTGERLSFTAFIIHCLSKAIEENPHLHAYRDWRNRLVIFEDVNINAMIEVEVKGRPIPTPHVFRAVNRMTLMDIDREMRAAQREPHTPGEAQALRALLYLPAILRRLFYWVVMRIPTTFRRFSSSVMVTAVGMFGKGGGWAITMPNFTLTVAVGGIASKPGVHEGQIAIREYLDLTLSVDHDIVDGGPIARFVARFQELLESGHGLETLSEA